MSCYDVPLEQIVDDWFLNDAEIMPLHIGLLDELVKSFMTPADDCRWTEEEVRAAITKFIEEHAPQSGSIAIQGELDRVGGKKIETIGEGDATLTLWELGDGRRVVETNGDPVWDTDDGFSWPPVPQIQIDRSGGQGHCWDVISRDEIPAQILEEIEGEIEAGENSIVASNGQHYRW